MSDSVLPSHPEQPGQAAPASSLETYLLEGKLKPPAKRDGWVDRRRLVEAMVSAVRRPVTLLAAPAGYGKTTLVAQWLQGPDRPLTAWVSLDSGDDDPGRLWSHVATALERAGCVLPVAEPVRVLAGTPSGQPRSLLSSILSALAAAPDDVVLVLDDFHLVQSAQRHDEVELLVRNLPPQAHLVIVSRSDPGLRLGRLRVSHDLAELRAHDLAFTVDEARAMLADKDVNLSATALADLVGRAEGWAAGLYLAALSLTGRSDPEDFVRRFSGTSRFIGDYLIEEVLSRQPEDLRNFILEVSVLDRFCAQLCDHVRGRNDSATVLHDLERANLFLVPLDGDGRWFRFQHLFGAVARSELELARPEDVQPLRARAGEWYSAHGHISDAIEQWLAADRPHDAAELVQAHWLQFADAGLAATVLGWLEQLSVVDGGPSARVTAAWMAAITGAETAMARHVESLEGFGSIGPLPDGSCSIESSLAQMRGLLGYGGPTDMLAAARRATQLETDSRSAPFAISQLALGHALYVQGDLDGAIESLQEAAQSGGAPGIIRVMTLSLQSFVENERGHLTRAREHAELAMDVLNRQALRAAPQASWAFVALAQAQAAAGKPDDALDTLEVGLAARRLNNAQGVWGPIHHLLLSARLMAQLGHTGRARDLMAELDQRMSRFTDGMTAMQAKAAAVRHLLGDGAEVATRTPTGEALTSSELRVLRLLPSTLTLREISSALDLSDNTVKSHLKAIYRKLGTHSRSETVELARRHALL